MSGPPPTISVDAVATAVSGVAALLGGASLLMPAAKRVLLPYTVLVAIFGALVGVMIAIGPQLGGLIGRTAALFQGQHLPSEALLYLFLPPLLFAAGLQMDFRRMLDDIWAVLLMAVVAVVLCCVVVGAALLPFMHDGDSASTIVLCLLVGAVVAPTDTAAILSIFKDIGAPRRLATIVEGESLFNDAAAIALVVVLIGALAGVSAGPAGAAMDFLKALGGGLALGWLAGYAAVAIAQFARGFVVAETTISLTLAYVTYAVAQLLFDVSGVIAVVAAAIAFGSRARTSLTPGSWSAMKALWQQLDFWATTLIFVFAAMEAPPVFSNLRWSDFGAVLAVYFAALVARAGVVFGVMPMLVWLKLSEPFSVAYRTALAWGGVRGAVTVVLALFVTEEAAVISAGPENARLILAIAFGYVLLTLFVNAPSLRLLMKLLRLDKLSPREQLIRNGVLALSRQRVEKAATDLAKELGLKRAKADISFGGQDAFLSHEERVQVGLLALINRETELAMRALERGLVDREVAEIVLAHAGRMFDLTRMGGIKAYREAIVRNHRMTLRLKMALWLHRRFGWASPLADEIALRFELLLAKTRILAQLQTFTREQVSLVIGQDASDELVEILSERQSAAVVALEAQEKQYPAYSTMVRELLVERVALAIEASEYQVQRDQGLISEEIFDDLESDRLQRVTNLVRRPPLNLGLEITDMVGRVPLFSNVSDAGRAQVARLLRPELAIQGERIIRAGTLGREMYFIVSGMVDVVLPGDSVRLEDGDFFGEVALLTSRPRNADVVAVSYCELLVLRKRDLDALINSEPEVKEQMEARLVSRVGAVAS